MPKKTRAYSREFKMNVVRLLETSGRSLSQVARDLGIPSANLHRWRGEYAHSNSYVLPRSNSEAIQEEVQKLKIEIEILRQEREVLKRAFSILSREY